MSTSQPRAAGFELCRFEIDLREPQLVASGEIDLGNSHTFAAALAEVARLGAGTIAELSGVTFMDSTGLSVLLEHRLDGNQVTVRNPSSCVARLLALTAVDGLVRIERT